MMYDYPVPATGAGPWPKPTEMAPVCEDHGAPMKWAAKHGASKGHWHCDACAASWSPSRWR